jgi:hypothetical protein
VQHEKAGGAGFLGHGAKQARFANARFTDDQRDLSASVTRALQHPAHRGDLQIATNQGRTDDVVLWMHSEKCCTDARVESMARPSAEAFVAARVSR